MATVVDPEQTDGRRARSERTRELIVEALMALIEEGNLQPTSDEVARRANVGHRTVFRHFEDMDSLYREIELRLEARVFAHVDPIAPEGPLEDRIAQLVRMRSTIYERIKMFRRATGIRHWTSAFLKKARRRNGIRLRDRLHYTVPELQDLPAEHRSAVELLMSFEAWEQLRTDQGCSIAVARATVEQAVRRLLG